MARQARRKRKSRKAPRCVLDAPWVIEGAVQRMKAIVDEKGWSIPPQDEIPVILKTTKGTDGENLAKEYGNLWRKMWQFFCLVGDYSSALLVNRSLCPTTPPPLDPVNVCAYLSYMCEKEGNPVLNARTKAPILDRRGQPVVARGSWSSPNSVYKLASAIKALHGMYRHLRTKIPYSSICTECVRINQQARSTVGQHLSCENCYNAFGRGCTQKSGCVMSDPTTAIHFKAMRAKLGETHRTKGNVQLTGGEIRQLRSMLLSPRQNGPCWLEGLKFYSMILVGISLFLRSDELLNIEMSQFITDMTMVRDIYGVRALILNIQGKSDPFPVSMVLWANDEHPDICPVRHLLVYIGISKVKEGYLFGPPYEFNENNEEHYPYDLFLSKLKMMCVDFLKRPDHGNIYGTHVLRKTGYLFAIFGFLKRFEPEYDIHSNRSHLPKMVMATIMKCARHSAVCNAATYMRDSMALYEWVRQAQTGQNHDVGIFRDCHVEDAEPFKAVLGDVCRAFQGSLWSVAEWYITTYLRLPLDDQLSAESCLGVATRTNSTVRAENELMGLIDQLSPQSREAARRCISKIKSDSFCFGQADNSPKTNSPQKASASPLKGMPKDVPQGSKRKFSSFEPDLSKKQSGFDNFASKPSKLPEEPVQKGRKFGQNNLEERKVSNWSKLGPPLKLAEYLVSTSKLKCSDLTGPARTFFYNWARPVASCVEKCHGGSCESFAAKYSEVLPLGSKGGKFSACQECRPPLAISTAKQ